MTATAPQPESPMPVVEPADSAVSPPSSSSVAFARLFRWLVLTNLVALGIGCWFHFTGQTAASWPWAAGSTAMGWVLAVAARWWVFDTGTKGIAYLAVLLHSVVGGSLLVLSTW